MLITEAYLKNTINLSQHKDPVDLKIALKNVTEFYIKDLLSIPLYELYLSHVEQGKVLTARQAELLEKVRFYYALMVQHELMFNLFSVTNRGNEQNQNSPSLQDIREKRAEVMGKAEAVKDKILAYLAAYRQDFPEYVAQRPTQADSAGYSPIVFY